MASITEILNLRTEFEEITYDFNMTSKCSSIDTIDWFLENGHRSNSLRNGFSYAKEIAKTIITEDTGWQKKQKQSMLQQFQEQI